MIEGSLRDAPLADVFQIIVSGQKSGVLTVIKDEARARVYFELGRVQFAHITPGIHLGEILVRLDLLTTHEVQKILLKQSSENAGTPLGLAAVDMGFLNEDGLRRALETQVLEVLTELMLWPSGSFHFAERSVSASQVPTEHTLDAMALLLEIAKRINEWEQGSVEAQTIFRKSGDPTRITLPKGSWDVLAYVDGKRRAASIAAELDLPERQVYRILYELQERNVIEALPFHIDDPLVLVISPSSALQRLIRLALQRAKLSSYMAQNFEVGMQFVMQQHPKAIVVDDDNGNAWNFVRELRKLPGQGHLPVLLLSNEEPSQGFFGRMRRPKANVLRKPFHEIDFQQLITQMLGRSLT